MFAAVRLAAACRFAYVYYALRYAVVAARFSCAPPPLFIRYQRFSAPRLPLVAPEARGFAAPIERSPRY